MKFTNMPADTFDLVRYVEVECAFSCLAINALEEERWINMKRLDKDMTFIIGGEEWRLYLFPPRAGNPTLVREHTTIGVYDNGHRSWITFKILKVYCRAGIVLRSNDDIRDYFFPEYPTIKEQLWRLKHER